MIPTPFLMLSDSSRVVRVDYQGDKLRISGVETSFTVADVSALLRIRSLKLAERSVYIQSRST